MADPWISCAKRSGAILKRLAATPSSPRPSAHLSPAEVILAQGETGNACYVLLSGQVAVSRTTVKANPAQIVATMKPGPVLRRTSPAGQFPAHGHLSRRHGRFRACHRSAAFPTPAAAMIRRWPTLLCGKSSRTCAARTSWRSTICRTRTVTCGAAYDELQAAQAGAARKRSDWSTNWRWPHTCSVACCRNVLPSYRITPSRPTCSRRARSAATSMT